MILSIDTTHEFGSIALFDAGEILEEMPLRAEDGFGHVLFGHISRLLERHGRAIGDVECFASASGPGSFTGVRVGLACVKGLAEALGRRVATVSNLQALASFGAGPLRATALDARRGEIYGAVFDAQLDPVAPEVVKSLPDWFKTLPIRAMEFISTDLGPFRGTLSEDRFTLIEAPGALAGAIAKIAAVRLAQGLALDPAEVNANYIRRSDAELFWQDPVTRVP